MLIRISKSSKYQAEYTANIRVPTLETKFHAAVPKLVRAVKLPQIEK